VIIDSQLPVPAPQENRFAVRIAGWESFVPRRRTSRRTNALPQRGCASDPVLTGAFPAFSRVRAADRMVVMS